MNDTFVDWLLDEMNRQGLSQAELAKKAGVSRTAISNLLNGSRGAGINLLNALAKGLELPIEEVLIAAGIRQSDPERPPGFEEWIYIYLNASEDQRQEMLAYARYQKQRHPANSRSS